MHVLVISDGIVGLQRAQESDEAPKLADARAFGAGSLNRGQEGTAMIEIIHDLAPGATISFAAVTTDLDHIAAVNYFAPRVDVIVDNVSYAYPANQRSDVSLNTTRALQQPDWNLRLYVTAAGNWAESHWSGEWQKGADGLAIGLPISGATHQFAQPNGGDALLGAGNGFVVADSDQVRLALFWDEPWGRAVNDYDLYLLSANGGVLASSATRQGVGAQNHLPREHLEYTHHGDPTRVYAVIHNPLNDAEPVRFNLFAFRALGSQVRLEHHTPSGSMLAQSDAEGAITVGAVNVGQDSVAAYSSRGPTANGSLKPDLVAVDGVTISNTTRFAPRFTGSSAAAPHVAGVAALLLEAQPALLAADGGSALLERQLIRDLLTDTARDLPPTGVDQASGAGLIDADAAIAAAIGRVAVVTSAADTGPATLREALETEAEVVLLSGDSDGQTIVLQRRLPTVADGAIVDGANWTLDASAVDVGIELGRAAQLWGLSVTGATNAGIVLSGRNGRLVDVEASDNAIGVRVDAGGALISSLSAERNAAHGLVVADGGSATVSGSRFANNLGAGIQVHPAAGNVVIAPADSPPAAVKVSDQVIPIAPHASAALEPRQDLSQQISGYVTIDGLPAAADARLDVYLDRRLAASVGLDDLGGFNVTVTGPGEELRFAVDDAPLDHREPFVAGADASLTLGAVSQETASVAELDGRANQIHDNQIGIEIMPVDARRAGRRVVWGNEMSGNATSLSSELRAPTIAAASWTSSGLSARGVARGASAVHLYAGSEVGDDRRYVASAAVTDGRFSFSHLNADVSTTTLSVIAHDAQGRATSESSPRRVAAPGEITSIAPTSGYIDGGDMVQICGDRIATASQAPRVWFDNRPARVAFWSADCVTVSSPPGDVGSVDIALDLDRSRAISATDAFSYRDVRTVRLTKGWNFVTWTGPATRVTSAFASIAGATFRAYAWDAEDQAWQLFATQLPPRLNTLRSVQRNQPLWVLLDSPDIDWEQAAPGR